MVVTAASWLLMCLVGLAVSQLPIPGKKDAYRVEVEGVEIIRDPKFIFKIDYARVAKYNQTEYVFNFAGTLLEDIPENAIYTVTAYEKLAVFRFSKIPLKLTAGRVKDFFLYDPFVIGSAIACSNINRTWPIPKKYIVIKDYRSSSAKNTPEELPGERWRIVHTVTDGRRELFKIAGLAYINRNL